MWQSCSGLRLSCNAVIHWSKSMVKKIIIGLILFSSVAIYAQSQVDTVQSDFQSNTKIESLQERNKELIGFQDKIIDTIHWSLGFAATFLILFLGINIYFQRNRYNEDKERFLKHIEDTIKVKSLELEKNIDPLIKSVVEKQVASIKSTLKSFDEKFNDSQIEINDLKLEVLKIQNAPKDTILSYYFYQAKDIKRANNYWKWGWKLAQCFEEMEKLLDNGAKFDSMEYPDVTKFIDSLPNEYSDVVHKFREKFRESSV